MCDFDSETDPRSQIIHMKKIQSEGLELFIKKNADLILIRTILAIVSICINIHI